MRGGLHLIAHKDLSTRLPLADASIPDVLTLSMRTNTDISVEIDSDATVLLGQLLAQADSCRLHASVSGKVVRIERKRGAVAIAIENDRRDAIHPTVRAIADHRQLSAEQLRERIDQAGILGLGGACFPTAAKLNVASAHSTPLLIVNGAECEPFITCDDVLMRERAEDIVLGTQVLLHASGAKHAIVAIESNKPQAATAISLALRDAHDQRIRLQVVATFYPAGGERQLIQTLTAREVPSGGLAADVDVLCQNVGTAAAAARLVVTGEPLISRIVTIAGEGINQPRNLRARFGTPIASLIADCGGYTDDVERLIMGGSMMGVALPNDTVGVTAATNCIIAATASDIAPHQAEMPCIRCGDCADVCPARLLPQQLLRYARLKDREALNELGLRDCIECGCCDYVCPSQIPLTSTFTFAKQAYEIVGNPE
jgi:electron transport complex protein RnfC